MYKTNPCGWFFWLNRNAVPCLTLLQHHGKVMTVEWSVKAIMTMDETIARINELFRKKNAVGLTDEELEEQKQLRQVYLTAIKRSLRDQLDHIEIVDDDHNRNQGE